MIFISKLFTAFFLPPGFFIIALLILVFFVPRRIKFVLGAITVLLYLVSIQPVSDALLRPLEDAFPPLSAELNETWPQAIVVLGGGTIQNSPEAGTGDTLSSDAKKRAVYAFTLRYRFPVPVFFSGGIVFNHDQESEAATAGKLFESLGLPYERILLEEKSRNTWENARETAKLGIERAILVTSAYHMRRSVHCFTRNNITVIPAPTDYKIQRGRRYTLLSFLPSMNSFNNTFLALHEYIGLVYYTIAYR